MNAPHNDGPDDLDSSRIAAEQSETRMRQALERLSGDRLGERPGGKPHHGSGQGGNGHQGSGHQGSGHQGGSHQGSGQASFSSAGPRRHRYVQDGEVPVVQISTMRERRRDATLAVPVAQDSPVDDRQIVLAQERAARQRAEQALERAQAHVHALETRLGHAEITQREAVDAARLHEAANLRLQSELVQMTAQYKAAEQQAAEALRRQHELELELEEVRAMAEPDTLFAPEPPPLRARNIKPSSARAKAKRPAKAELPAIEAEEPEPVKWWLVPAPKTKLRRAG